MAAVGSAMLRVLEVIRWVEGWVFGVVSEIGVIEEEEADRRAVGDYIGGRVRLTCIQVIYLIFSFLR